MADELKKVKRGDPLVIPAATFNAFVDAAFDYRRRQRDVTRDASHTFRQLGIIPIRNDTGEDLDRFSAVGIAGPIIGPDDNPDEFKNRAMASGIKPIVPDHRGRFAVMLEPVKDGKVAMGCVSGVIPCRINVDEETHLRADIEHDETILLTGHHGGAEILWKEEGKGIKWSIIKVGIAEPLAITFDVKLVQRYGEAGENCKKDCTYTYDIYDIHTDEKLNDDDPQAPIDPRPEKTQMIVATRGTAFWTVKEVDGKPAIAVQLEEAFEEPTPRKQQYVVTGISCDEGSGSGGGTAGHGSGGCCDFTLKYHTAKVCYPPGTKIEPGPTFTVRCGSSSSGSSSGSGSSFDSSSGSSSGSSGSSGSPSSSDSSSGSSGSPSGSSSPSGSPPPSSGPSGSSSGGSGSDKSTAIVPASWSPTGYTALFVEESPEVRFNDVMVVEVPARDTRLSIDPRFLEVCAPGSLEVTACQPDAPVLVGARVDGGEVVLQFAQQSAAVVRLVISLTGIRKGFSGLRFPDRTQRQFEANERFIRSAYPHD
ncbi:MAG: hypothetical protein GC159_06965 [Phycisphaera sp.]|nr:hypothetical protein [Phycisphaera sp.]